MEKLEKDIKRKRNQIKKIKFDIEKARESKKELEETLEDFTKIVDRFYFKCYHAIYDEEGNGIHFLVLVPSLI